MKTVKFTCFIVMFFLISCDSGLFSFNITSRGLRNFQSGKMLIQLSIDCMTSLIMNRNLSFDKRGNTYQLEYEDMIIAVKHSEGLASDLVFSNQAYLLSKKQVIIVNDEVYDCIYRYAALEDAGKDAGPEMIAFLPYQRIDSAAI